MDENNTSSLMKLTLYDRIFKPQTVTLSNGHSVQRRRSRAPLIVLFLVVIIWLSLKMTGFDLHVVITKFRKMVDLLEKIFQPDLPSRTTFAGPMPTVVTKFVWRGRMVSPPCAARRLRLSACPS